MEQIKAVFFDAAGTLFDTREPVGESYARIARAYGLNASAGAVDAAFRRAFHDAVPLAFGTGHDPEQLRRLEREWWRELVMRTFAGLGNFADFGAFFNSLFEFFANPAHWRADAEALPMLNALRERGLTLGVISNFDYRLYRILDGLGLAAWFDSITISSEAGYAKPSVKLFEAALEQHRLAPFQAVHVGDSEHLDLAGASAAGMAAILINPKLAEEDVSVAGRTARISSFRAVPDVVSLFDHAQARS
ncbi:MAG TPA: HAD-IA family hydrolase [Candidatus Binataceae bacterium]|nr:HAD-IA family hydrolase [Candidatus Binataceae bacterium]